MDRVRNACPMTAAEFQAALMAAWKKEGIENRFGLGWLASNRIAELEGPQQHPTDHQITPKH